MALFLGRPDVLVRLLALNHAPHSDPRHGGVVSFLG